MIDHFDVVVVGGGIAGASAAWALAARHSTLLVEREGQFGIHATGRSAAVLSETSGTATTCALAAASRSFLERPPEGFAEHPLLRERGLVWVGAAGDESALDLLAARGAAVRASVRRLDRHEVLELVPVLRPERAAVGGVHEPDAVTVDVDALLQAYLRGLRKRRGTVRPGAELLTAHRAHGAWALRLPGGDVRCEVIVDAAGAWGDEVAARCEVEPIGLRALRRTALLVAGDDAPRSLPLVMDVAGRFYFEPESGGLLVSPADETPSAPCDATPEQIDVALALERVSEATTMAPRHVRRAWAGLRTFSPDRSPVVGPDPAAEGFWWLVGQGGAGIKTAPALAATIASLLYDGSLPSEVGERGVQEQALSPARFRAPLS